MSDNLEAVKGPVYPSEVDPDSRWVLHERFQGTFLTLTGQTVEVHDGERYPHRFNRIRIDVDVDTQQYFIRTGFEQCNTADEVRQHNKLVAEGVELIGSIVVERQNKNE